MVDFEDSESFRSYIAIDGREIVVPPAPPLPEERPDLERFRAAARECAAAQSERSHAHPLNKIQHEFDHLDYPFRETTEAQKREKSGSLGRLEDALIAARQKRIRTAEARGDALIDALEGGEGGRLFALRITDVLGFNPKAYAEGYRSVMAAEHGWVLDLLDALPPKTLAEALSTLIRPHLFDPHRLIFFEPALEKFLNGPYGDLRHLEGDAAWSPPPSIFDSKPASGDDKAEAERCAAAFAAQSGVAVDPKDLEANPEVAYHIRRRMAERENAVERLARGALLAHFLRVPAAYSRLTSAPQELLWRYVASRMELVDMALGLEPAPKGARFSAAGAIRALRCLPAPPMRYKDAIFGVAVGAKKLARRDAQRLLRGAGALVDRLAKQAGARKADIRLQAVACLGETGDARAKDVLSGMLEREDDLQVTNAILAALQRLGADISAHAPIREELIVEARAGLDGPLPEKRRWLAYIDTPPLHFADGSPAHPETGPWLLRYAANLGLPQGGPLIEMRLGLLDAESRELLGRAVLEGWIQQDTLRWDQISFETHRPIFEREMYQVYCQLNAMFRGATPDVHPLRKSWQGKPMSIEQFAAQIDEEQIAEFLRGKLNWGVYLFSAYDGKGALALARDVPAGELVAAVTGYIEHHGRRSHQSKVLIDLLASIDHDAVRTALERIAEFEQRKGLRTYAAETLEDLGLPVPIVDEEPSASG